MIDIISETYKVGFPIEDPLIERSGHVLSRKPCLTLEPRIDQANEVSSRVRRYPPRLADGPAPLRE